jgi:hypothetical protein
MALLVAYVVAMLSLAVPCPAETHASTADVVPPGRTTTTVFRLHVAGHPVSGASFWVAYGPLADHWGLVRLHAVGRGTYAATRILPVKGRTVFAYLAGRGSMWTRAGTAPGSPIVTICLIGPMSATHLGTTTIQWHAPIG